MSGEHPNSEPIPNSAFSKTITWRVLNEEIFPQQVISRRTETRYAVSSPETVEIPQRQTLSVSASIGGHARFVDTSVTRGVLATVGTQPTVETSSRKYPLRLLGWGGLWVVAFALTWPALSSLSVVAFIVVFAVIAVTPLLFAGALVDFLWWSGRGFANESRAKWILAAVLWVLDLGPLIYLQILVR